MKPIKTILAISVSGIGNTILFTPVLRSLRRHFPDARIDLLTRSRPMAAPVEGSGLVAELLVLGDRPNAWPAAVWRLRRTRYDASVLAFPSNTFFFHALSFAIGARGRYAHRYPGFHLRTLGFLETATVQAVEGLHDVEQNLNLLSLFGIQPAEGDRALTFDLNAEDHAFAECWIRERGVTARPLVGIHPGAGGALADLQGSAKRWPVEQFIGLSRRLIEETNATVLVFGGPSEDVLKERIVRSSPASGRVIAATESLKHTAALIRACDLMISNDSGLMHVAAALGVPTLGIFGPTNPSRTAPYGPACRYLHKPAGGSPALLYPFRSTSSRIRRHEALKAYDHIGIEEVLALARDMIRSRKPGDAPGPS